MRSATFGGIGLTSQHFDFNGLTALLRLPIRLLNNTSLQRWGATAPAIILRSVLMVPVGPAVPQPSTWVMMLLGFCGLGFMGGKRSQPQQWANARSREKFKRRRAASLGDSCRVIGCTALQLYSARMASQ